MISGKGVFSWCRKIDSDGTVVVSSGSLFHITQQTVSKEWMELKALESNQRRSSSGPQPFSVSQLLTEGTPQPSYWLFHASVHKQTFHHTHLHETKLHRSQWEEVNNWPAYHPLCSTLHHACQDVLSCTWPITPPLEMHRLCTWLISHT